MRALAMFLAALAACFAAQPALAQGGLPTIQAVQGKISPSKSGTPVKPASSDELILINKTTNKRESAAFSIDRDGNYLVVITKDSSFNNTPLTLRLRKDTKTFNLVDTDTNALAEFVYAGTLLGGDRITLNLIIGSLQSTTAPPGPTTPPPGTVKPVNTNPDAVECSAPKFDVNGDGKCDEADIEQIQNYLRTVSRDPRSGAPEARSEDVNSDGVVNGRDLLDSVRALQRARVDALRKSATRERPAIERPAEAERPSADVAKEIDAARSSARERQVRPQ